MFGCISEISTIITWDKTSSVHMQYTCTAFFVVELYRVSVFSLFMEGSHFEGICKRLHKSSGLDIFSAVDILELLEDVDEKCQYPQFREYLTFGYQLRSPGDLLLASLYENKVCKSLRQKWNISISKSWR